MNIVAIEKDQLSIVKDLAYAIWPVAYAEILSQEQLEYMLSMFYSEEALAAQLEKGHVFYLVQNNSGDYLGFVSYELNCEPDKTKIHKIYVLPETQGLGLGKLLFEKVKEEALKANQKAIFLNVNKYNQAKFFYEKLGLKIVKEEVIDIGRNYVMDDYVMELAL
ncbi:GNAT family N-acetyltransferase [Flavobacterium sp. TP390]|uniref:GNAT family N-acetyltransferase n=1 Tax=Flavobacterium profundi TaxID=1774945 RepID=A0A6I4IHU6_9FLAO|nr:GNAT family N-acetyltransferase [Flavobacterium profundi]MVO09240.1 GNAT family N-acetyltransferase [Flavobacterium profundi]